MDHSNGNGKSSQHTYCSPKSYYLLLNGSSDATEHGRRHSVAMAANLSLLTSCGVPINQIECLFANGEVDMFEVADVDYRLSTSKNAKPIRIDHKVVEDHFHTISSNFKNLDPSGITENDYLIVKIFSHSLKGSGGILWNFGIRRTVFSILEFIEILSKKFKYRHLYIFQPSSYGRQSLENLNQLVPNNVTIITASLKYCYTEHRIPTDQYHPLDLMVLAELITLGNYDLKHQWQLMKQYYLADASNEISNVRPDVGVHFNNFSIFTGQSITNNTFSDKLLSEVFQIDIDSAKRWLQTYIVDLDMKRRCDEVLICARNTIISVDIKPDTFLDINSTILPESDYDELLLDTFYKLKKAQNIQEQTLLRMEFRDLVKKRDIQFMYLLLLLHCGNWLDLWVEKYSTRTTDIQNYDRDLVNEYMKIALQHNFLFLNCLVVDNYNNILCYLAEFGVKVNEFESAVIKITSLPKYPFICKPTDESTDDERKLYLLTVLHTGNWLHHYTQQLFYTDQIDKFRGTDEFDDFHHYFTMNVIHSIEHTWYHEIALKITVQLYQKVTLSELKEVITNVDRTLVSI
jgi:hypothetical protein